MKEAAKRTQPRRDEVTEFIESLMFRRAIESKIRL